MYAVTEKEVAAAAAAAAALQQQQQEQQQQGSVRTGVQEAKTCRSREYSDKRCVVRSHRNACCGLYSFHRSTDNAIIHTWAAHTRNKSDRRGGF